MNKELAFAKKLEEIRVLAKEQGNVLSIEQVEEAFAEIEIGKEQLEPVYGWLNRETFNNIAPLIQTRIANLKKNQLYDESQSGNKRT